MGRVAEDSGSLSMMTRAGLLPKPTHRVWSPLQDHPGVRLLVHLVNRCYWMDDAAHDRLPVATGGRGRSVNVLARALPGRVDLDLHCAMTESGTAEHAPRA